MSIDEVIPSLSVLDFLSWVENHSTNKPVGTCKDPWHCVLAHFYTDKTGYDVVVTDTIRYYDLPDGERKRQDWEHYLVQEFDYLYLDEESVEVFADDPGFVKILHELNDLYSEDQ